MKKVICPDCKKNMVKIVRKLNNKAYLECPKCCKRTDWVDNDNNAEKTLSEMVKRNELIY